jgi:hypothetical protein
MDIPRDKWVEQLDAVVNKYNNTNHRTIDMTPNEAKKSGNQMMVSFNLWNKAKRSRTYPDLKKDDEVRVMNKKKITTKGFFPKYSTEKYRVIGESKGGYLIDDGKRQVYLRSELLKV